LSGVAQAQELVFSAIPATTKTTVEDIDGAAQQKTSKKAKQKATKTVEDTDGAAQTTASKKAKQKVSNHGHSKQSFDGPFSKRLQTLATASSDNPWGDLEQLAEEPKLPSTSSHDNPWGDLGQLGDEPELQASRPRVKSG
jgi:hypothetical protein